MQLLQHSSALKEVCKLFAKRHTVMLKQRLSLYMRACTCVCVCVCVCVCLVEAGGDSSSQLTGEHICLGRAIMQDLVPRQPAVERGSVCCVFMCTSVRVSHGSLSAAGSHGCDGLATRLEECGFGGRSKYASQTHTPRHLPPTFFSSYRCCTEAENLFLFSVFLDKSFSGP